MKKNLLALLGLYTFQFLLTACTCNCPPVKTYNSVYTDFVLESWDTSGFNSSETTTSAFKNAFGLSINFNVTDERVASKNLNINLSNFGFATAYAWSCDCPFDTYLIPDPIIDIEILVTNTVTEEKIIVTENFESSNYYRDEDISLKELFQDSNRWIDNYRLDLVGFDNIPDSSIFTVTIFLESGRELIQKTDIIEFL